MNSDMDQDGRDYIVNELFADQTRSTTVGYNVRSSIYLLRLGE